MVLKETIAKVWLLYLTLPFLLLYATESYVLQNRHPVTFLLLYQKRFHLFYATASFSFHWKVKHNTGIMGNVSAWRKNNNDDDDGDDDISIAVTLMINFLFQVLLFNS